MEKLLLEIGARLFDCNHDELRVIDSILAGLEKGRSVYGPLDLQSDPRDWQREAAEERRDTLIYDACCLISRQDRGGS